MVQIKNPAYFFIFVDTQSLDHMLKAILDNPYRILGIYSNATDNEIIAAVDKLISSPDAKCETDFPIPGLQKPRRDSFAVLSAKQKVLDLNESLCHKMFWFMRSNDDAGIEELKKGDISAASNHAWFRSFTKESRHNQLVGDLIEGSFSKAAREAYELLSDPLSSYKEVLGHPFEYEVLLNQFKAQLFDEANTVPLGSGLPWKRYVQNKVRDDITDYFFKTVIPKAESQIDEEVVSSFNAALSTLQASRKHLCVLREFIDTTSPSYKAVCQEITNDIQDWTEKYLQKSKDIFKYDTVCLYPRSFAEFAQTEIKASYMRLFAWNLRQTCELKMLPETCDLANRIAAELHFSYKTGLHSSASYCTRIERVAPLFIQLKQSTDSDECYKKLSNLMASVGLFIIKKELKGELTDQKVADAATVICYIDNVIENKHLEESIRKDRDLCMQRIFNMGGGSTSVMAKMHWDPALFFDEDKTFKYCVNSLRGCQNYLKRFPNGKYVQEVTDKISRNEFEALHSSQNNVHSTPTNKSTTATTTHTQPVKGTSHQNDHVYQEIECSSVLTYVLIAFTIEVLLGFLTGTRPMLICGIILSLGYWLITTMSGKKMDKDAKKWLSIFLVFQTVISIFGLFIIP